MEELNFHVITPYYGPSDWLEECMHSVKMQTLPVKHHVIIDNDRKGACRNHFETLQLIPPTKNNIVIHLDGDDKLINHKALEILAEEYQDSNTWVTYGNYISRQGSVCRPLNELPFRQSFQTRGWSWSHLRTFRAHLIPYLQENDMKDFAGNWFSAASDVAIFLPILEMSGKDRVKFIDKDLVYYRIHGNNDHAEESKLRDQIRCSLSILNKKPYGLIK